MSFIQIVEFSTSKIDEMRKRSEQFLKETEGQRPPGKATVCEDRDNRGHYYLLVEFPSYEEAMENSAKPETQAMAEDMANLADGPPTFRNLDVLETWDT